MGFFMNFELLPILTDYEIEKRGDEINKKIFSSETTHFSKVLLRLAQ
jgi:hypothetical protein